MWWPNIMVSQHHGVTLIELMIAIALLAMLALAIFPLGRAWVANAQITKTEKLFLETYTRAKNEAIRNPNAVPIDSTTPAAVLIVDNTNKKIIVRNKDDSTADSIVLQVAIEPTVTVTLSDECSNKIPLNNNAYVMTANCTVYTISANGGTNATGAL
ncbi:prepilin-type N-terminal cleavage/methylation domain-containing protein [Acinetobacter sp.]|uniref:prepilin-type N-terminal cleavage/methylation domain-containing protein n=1 Tax=Acinetobacter sp. TaxID=472 RepID=UPI0028A8E7D6|nr:prepilin-type N-terminal cleavage/methylation domain-containing protein [Acinetobacter sp.]